MYDNVCPRMTASFSPVDVGRGGVSIRSAGTERWFERSSECPVERSREGRGAAKEKWAKEDVPQGLQPKIVFQSPTPTPDDTRAVPPLPS